MPDREEISIKEEFIRLDSFLKFAAAVSSGGEAKYLVQEGKVTVNGEICLQRGRKIYPGDLVSAEGLNYIVRGEAK